MGVQQDIANIAANVQYTREKIESMDERLAAVVAWKDGTGDQPGMAVRMDRVERFTASMIWAGGIIIGGLLVALTAGGLTAVRAYWAWQDRVDRQSTTIKASDGK